MRACARSSPPEATARRAAAIARMTAPVGWRASTQRVSANDGRAVWGGMAWRSYAARAADARTALGQIQHRAGVVNRTFARKYLGGETRLPQRVVTLTTLIAVLGVFGVVSFGVAARRRELGSRLALGALPRQVGTLILWSRGVVAGATGRSTRSRGGAAGRMTESATRQPSRL